MTTASPKIWKQNEIRELLHRSEVARLRGLVQLFYRQTPDEVAGATTLSNNGEGFTTGDAKVLTSYARKLLKNNQPLTDYEAANLAKRMLKYAGQLTRIANSRNHS